MSMNKIAEGGGVVVNGGEGTDLRIADLAAFVHPAEEGGYWAEVPALPGCITEGDTLDEVVANLNEAITGWLQAQTPESLDALGVAYAPLFRTGEDKSAPAGLPLFRSLEFAA